MRRMFTTHWKHFEFSVSFTTGPQVFDILDRLSVHNFIINFVVGESIAEYRVNPDEAHVVYIHVDRPVTKNIIGFINFNF